MTAIVCVDKNWAIGRENRLLFRISADLKHFRALTTGKTVVMGKNTLLSLPGGRPLPNRRNLVVSTTMAPREGVEIARSIEEAAALAGEDAVLMGGAQLYRALLPRCERVLVTQVDAAAEGADAFYTGPVARKMVEQINQRGGCFTLEDLSRYQPKYRTPVKTTYRGLEVAAFAPPSGGCVFLYAAVKYEFSDIL